MLYTIRGRNRLPLEGIGWPRLLIDWEDFDSESSIFEEDQAWTVFRQF